MLLMERERLTFDLLHAQMLHVHLVSDYCVNLAPIIVSPAVSWARLTETHPS